MAKSKIEFHMRYKGVGELLKSQEMESICMDHARQIANRAGEGFEADAFTGNRKVMAGVKPVTAEAYQKNLNENTLLKAMR